MSRLSGLIETWVESMLKSMWPRSRYQELSFSMSPESFSREYWSSRRYHDSQLPSRDSQVSRISSLLKLSVPTRLTWRILAALPSLTSMVTSTRLRSSWATEGVICTLYLPRLLYWRTSSWVTRSRARRSKVSPSARPMSCRPRVRSSVLMSLLPCRVSLLIAGRSATVTTRMSPWRSRRTSSKNPVRYSARMVSPAALWSSTSPRSTGR